MIVSPPKAGKTTILKKIGQTRFLADWRQLAAELERKKTKV
jgi:transcription termination factor Rho